MFTGIVGLKGVVRTFTRRGEGARIVIEAVFPEGLEMGESIAVNGVCLTVSGIETEGFSADISRETLERSTLAQLRPGREVNLERALRAGGRFGGHIVQGHVDCVGKLLRLRRAGDFASMVVSFPRRFDRFIVEKGSIAIDGVSLTVARKCAGEAEMSLIPTTLASTALAGLSAGAYINIEFDIIAKYVENMVIK